MAFLKILFYLIVLIVVLALAYYTTRMLGRGMGRSQRTGGMEILDQMALGRDSYLLVVKVQDRIFLMGVTSGGISKIEELESYDKKGAAEAAPDFVSLLSSHMKERFSGKGTEEQAGEKGRRKES
ncbi:MAG: flagellar biosynthetic protein FliO [Clostridia bacterium]|nr:flagellar biosynthetic protein FliO [Clostridia bacterium]